MRDYLERAAAGVALCPHDLHIVLDALPTPISWATIPDGNIRFVNQSFHKTFGYTGSEFTNVDELIERAYPRQDDRERARRAWSGLWETGSSGVSDIDAIEVEIRCADGSCRTVQHRGIMLHDVGIGIATFEDITDRKRAEDALRVIAFEDPLTGLANRRALQDRWAQEASRAEPVEAAILVLDLDGFKDVNDRLGHDAGDEVLMGVADRLRRSVRQDDLVCRIGGDEFVVLLPDVRFPAQVEGICGRIDAALRAPFQVGRQRVQLGASTGASLYPQDGQDLRALIKAADDALYRVKAARKGGWAWFAEPVAA